MPTDRKKKNILAKGKPVSNGKTIGKVKIITSFSTKQVTTEEIAVMEYLKPFDSPFVINARGFILEKGSQFCHAAILARELSIPCMIIPDAKKKLYQNQSILLDCDSGIVIDKTDSDKTVA